jgi:hypothetical protein
MKLNMYKIMVCNAYLNQTHPTKRAKIWARYENTINEMYNFLKEYEKYSLFLDYVSV